METEEATKAPQENTELVEKKPVEHTPFTAIKAGDKWFLACNKYRITPPLDSYEECEKEAHVITWDKIAILISIMIENQPKKFLTEK